MLVRIGDRQFTNNEYQLNLYGVLLDPVDIWWYASVHSRIVSKGATFRPWYEPDKFSINDQGTARVALQKG